MAMIAFGVGEVIGSNVHGYLTDKFTSKKAALFLMLFMVLMTVATLIAIHTHYGVSSYVMTFLYGFQDGSLNVQMFQLLGFSFKNSTDPFGVFLFVQGLSIFVFQLA